MYEFPELSDEMMVYEVLFEMREQQKTKMLLVEGFHFKEKEMHQPQPLGEEEEGEEVEMHQPLALVIPALLSTCVYSCPCS